MRIRKHASRLLLGTQSTIAPHSPSAPSSFNSSPCGVDVCELNCSPWDLAGANKTPSKEADGSRGISGNFKNVKEEEEEEKQGQQEPITVVVPNSNTNTNAADSSVRAAQIRKEEEGKTSEVAGVEAAIRSCNKRGRDWHCTRPAEPNHSFCSYHLGRLRAHMSNRNGSHNKKRTGNNDSNSRGGNKRVSQDAVAVSESDSYYYYGGFGPWRGKRRATAEADGVKVGEELAKEEEEEDAERSDVLLIKKEEGDDDDIVKGDDDQGRIVLCNKRGRGWHCTRPAERPHSFCNYHLTILRSYVSGRKSAKKIPHSNNKKKKLLTSISASDDDSDAYGDGGGFDPWKGKRRGGADVKVKTGNIADYIDINPRDDPDYDLDMECENTFSKSEGSWEATSASLCRKKDGKGWHCKRPAQPPLSYCSHHLALNRSYNASNQQSNVTKGEIVNTTESNNNKRVVPMDEKASGGGGGDINASYESNFYYYDGFGPCRGKSRGRRAIDLNVQFEEQAQEEEEEDEVVVRETNSECNVAVVDRRELEEGKQRVALNLNN